MERRTLVRADVRWTLNDDDDDDDDDDDERKELGCLGIGWLVTGDVEFASDNKVGTGVCESKKS